MSKILDEIKGAFEDYKENVEFLKDRGSVCTQNPFGEHWMYNYLFPEMLMVAEDYLVESYKESIWADCFVGFLEFHSNPDEGLTLFPCWVMPESEVLRIMAEHGIL